MQAGGGRAAGMAAVQVADPVAGGHEIAGADGRGDRFVGGAEAAGVRDAHDVPAGDRAGVEDRAGAGGADRCAGRGGQVCAAVAGEPRLRRRVERADDARGTGERPDETTDRQRGRSGRDRHCERDRTVSGGPGAGELNSVG